MSALLALLSPRQQQALKKVKAKLLEEPTSLDNRPRVEDADALRQSQKDKELPPHVR